MGIVLMVFGIIMSVLGGIGFVVTENWMNDPDFWWDYAGTSRYTSAIDMHSISMVVMGAGVLFLLLGVVLYVTRRSNEQQMIYQEQRRKESVRYENKGIGKEYAVAGMVFTGLGIAAVAAGCIFWISPLIIILVLLFFPLGIIFSRIAAKKKKAYLQTSRETEEDSTEEDSTEEDLPAFCSSCGKRRRPGDVFCSGCGKKLV